MTGSRALPAAGERFRAAAALLRSPDASPSDPAAAGFLRALGLAGRSGADAQHEIAMLEFAAGLDTFFRIESPFAPGAFFCGGTDRGSAERPPGSYSGRGTSLGQAFFSCAGEAAEYAAMHRLDSDPRVVDEGGAAVVRGRALGGGEPVSLPVGKLLREPGGREQPTSTGYAAGPTMAAAIQGAFLECVERDAIARWVLGATEACEIGPDETGTVLAERIGRTSARPVRIANISPAGALAHAVVAVSSDESAMGTAFGFGSAFSRASAVEGALLELCQGEIGLLAIDRKRRERGPSSLGPRDMQALSRAAYYRPGHGLLAFSRAEKSNRRSIGKIEDAVQSAAASGIDILAFDLTLPQNRIPVAKVIVEGFLDAALLPPQGDRPQVL